MVLIVPRVNGNSFSQLIERDAKRLFNAKRHYPISMFVPAAKLAAVLRLSEYRLYQKAKSSSYLHAFRLPTGELLYHPEAAILAMQRHFRAIQRTYTKLALQ